MRIPLIAMAMLPTATHGCGSGTNESTATAIYVPPPRLGGSGSVMYLPATRSPVPTSDADVVRTVLAIIGPGHCVVAALGQRPFTDLRIDIAEAEAPETKTREGRALIVSARAGGWSWTTEKGPVDAGLAARLRDAAIAIIERDHRLPLPRERRRANGPKLAESWLAPGQSLGERADCTTVIVSEVARDGALAFVDVGIMQAPMAGAGRRWVLEQSRGAWRVVATQLLWVS